MEPELYNQLRGLQKSARELRQAGHGAWSAARTLEKFTQNFQSSFYRLLSSEDVFTLRAYFHPSFDFIKWNWERGQTSHETVSICLHLHFWSISALNSFDLATKMSQAVDRRDIDVIMLCSTMRLPRLMIFVCKYSNICTDHFFLTAHKQHSILTNQTGFLDF